MYWHLMVEAKKLAYSDLLGKNADPKFANVPVAQLLSKSYRRRSARRSIRMSRQSRASPAARRRDDLSDDGRSLGNMVSLVHSVFSVYGSRATSAVRLRAPQPRQAFSLDPKSPNIVAPHKRRSTRSSPAS
jgi:gamma-glutamyltranspeptidase/glutathione hydrolase